MKRYLIAATVVLAAVTIMQAADEWKCIWNNMDVYTMGPIGNKIGYCVGECDDTIGFGTYTRTARDSGVAMFVKARVVHLGTPPTNYDSIVYIDTIYLDVNPSIKTPIQFEWMGLW